MTVGGRGASRQRRWGALALACALAVAACAGEADDGGQATPTPAQRPAAASDEGSAAEARPTPTAPPTPTATPSPTPTPTPSPTPTPDGRASTERELRPVRTIEGDIAPKSVVAAADGRVFAQNMMYAHTITVYDADGELLETISDEVDLSDHSTTAREATVRGAPVEAALSADGAYAYVSNYSMYGPGFDHPGSDSCAPEDGRDESFVYRIDVDDLAIDEVIAVGSTPKFVATTPDDAHVLVTNWCSYDLSVIDAAAAEEVERIDLGRYPRGIAVDPDGDTAYVAVMGGTDIAVVDLADFTVGWMDAVGDGPRDLVMDPDGEHLYATLNRDGTVIKVDLADGDVVAEQATGQAPRSMTIADDGAALYVVNYHSDTVSKLAAEDLEVLQEVGVAHKPIGITRNPATGDVWVSSYSGVISVFEDA